MKNKKQRITIYLSYTDISILKFQALNSGRTVSNYIAYSINQGLKKQVKAKKMRDKFLPEG